MPQAHWVWDGTAWKQTKSGGLYVQTALSGLAQVNRAWVWDGAAWKLHYVRAAPVSLTAVVNAWDRITLSWPSIAAGATYKLKRGSTEIYSGPLLNFADSLLMPSTAYTYTLEGYLDGTLQSTDTKTATTLAYADPGLVASSPAWWCNDISWSDPSQGSVDYYVLLSGGTRIYENYASAGKSFRHSNLYPSTVYNYTLECYRLPGTLIKTDTVSVTTAGHSLSLSAWAPAYHYTHLDWSDSDQGMGQRYHLWVDGGGYAWVDVNARSYDVGGLGENSYHTYQLQLHNDTYGMIAPISNAVGVTQPARPVAYGTAYSNVGWENFTGWTGSTQRNLGGPNIYVGVGGTFTNMHALVYSHAGQNFRGEPRINGVAGPQQVYNVGRSHTNWPFNLGFGAGTFTTNMVVGGTNWGQAEWSPWSGQRWDYYLQVNHLDYWYYSSREMVNDLMERYEWMTPQLAEVMVDKELQILSWSNEEGTEWTKVQIGDRDSGELYVDWKARHHIDYENKIQQPEWDRWLHVFKAW